MARWAHLKFEKIVTYNLIQIPIIFFQGRLFLFSVAQEKAKHKKKIQAGINNYLFILFAYNLGQSSIFKTSLTATYVCKTYTNVDCNLF